MIDFYCIDIPDVKILKPKVFCDDRGSFSEVWNQGDLNSIGISDVWVQDNILKTIKGALRGVHTQLNHPQSKIVNCCVGRVYDVVVDCRFDSPAFGKWFGVELSAENHKQIYVPENVAHGFIALEDSIINMKVSTHYFKGDEVGFIYSDPNVGIAWPKIKDCQTILAEKDLAWGSFDDMMNVIKTNRF